MRKFFALLAVALACAASAAPAHPESAERAPLVLISLDGFRADYCERHPAETPHLQRLAREGVTAQALIPVFPSNTFPNHYSIVTGLYPSHHGILNNLMFDPARGEYFRYNRAASASDGRWWGGEPVWVTAIRQGLKSACALWPGSEAEIGGVRPTFWKPYDYRTPFDQRLDEAVGWLRDGGVSFLSFYLEEVNGVGHRSGPGSPELAAAIKLTDSRVGALVARLAAEKISANLVIVSDHGMTPCSVEQVVVLDDYLDLTKVQIDFDETVAGLHPLGDYTVANLMRDLEKLPATARAYRSENLPAHFRIDPRQPRVPPVWILPAEGWQVARRSVYEAAKPKFLKGQHGYDPALPSMHGFFLAHGPGFKSGVQIEAVENIHVYNLLCAALGLKPARSDGDDRLVKAALQ